MERETIERESRDAEINVRLRYDVTGRVVVKGRREREALWSRTLST